MTDQSFDENHCSPNQFTRQYTEIAKLAGGLAHEIKNPLSTIRLNMELLEEELLELQSSPQQRRAIRKVDIVKRECLRLEELLNDFLDYTRSHHLVFFPADANKDLREILDFFRPKAVESGIELITYFGNDLPTIAIDKRSFHRAILNLLLNALEAMPGGGQLVIRTRIVGSDIAIDLIDSGGGINHEIIENIFEPFFSTKQGGCGLGLPTVRRIIEGHGGRIGVESEPQRGTQFTLTFPSLPRIENH